MIIEKTDNEIIIRISSKVSMEDLQRLIDFIRYKEATAESKATQEEIDQLAEEVNLSWWERNKSRFIKE